MKLSRSLALDIGFVPNHINSCMIFMWLFALFRIRSSQQSQELVSELGFGSKKFTAINRLLEAEFVLRSRMCYGFFWRETAESFASEFTAESWFLVTESRRNFRFLPEVVLGSLGLNPEGVISSLRPNWVWCCQDVHHVWAYNSQQNPTSAGMGALAEEISQPLPYSPCQQSLEVYETVFGISLWFPHAQSKDKHVYVWFVVQYCVSCRAFRSSNLGSIWDIMALNVVSTTSAKYEVPKFYSGTSFIRWK